MSSQEKSVHSNHRERMRERSLHGYESYADHELLEMLLYNCVRRGDTNEIGHLLMERFGSINGVLEASADELMSVRGIGLAAATHIKTIAEAMRRYIWGYVEDVPQYDTIQKIVEFIWPRFFGLDHERLYMMLFNNKMAMIDCSVMADGTVNSANVTPGILVTRAMAKKASTVVLAHNHPHGENIGSSQDVELTNRFTDAFSLVGISLLEHIVIAEDRFEPIVKNRCKISSTLLSSNCSLVGASGFEADRFYNIDEKTYRFDPIMDAIFLPHEEGN